MGEDGFSRDWTPPSILQSHASGMAVKKTKVYRLSALVGDPRYLDMLGGSSVRPFSIGRANRPEANEKEECTNQNSCKRGPTRMDASKVAHRS